MSFLFFGLVCSSGRCGEEIVVSFDSIPYSRSRSLGFLLSGAESLYAWGQRWDGRRQARKAKRSSIPVISIGNLTVGGVGKTPVVEQVARAALERGWRPAILSRGYGGDDGGNDEYRFLARRLPGVPHAQGSDRFLVGETLLAEMAGAQVPTHFILDDGFQHRRLHRDLDVVVLDATRPLGLGRLLPRGFCREPWTALSRADAFVITRRELADEESLRLLRAFLRDHFPRRPVFEVESGVPTWRGPDGETVESLPTGPTLAFAGIGNPEAFFADLERDGVSIRGRRVFADHHRYRAAELVELRQEAERLGVGFMVATEKDGVKLETLPGYRDGLPVYQRQQSLTLPADRMLDLLSPRPSALG